MFDEEFISKVESCWECKFDFEGLMRDICDILTIISPCDYSFYFKSNGFFCVDIPFEDVNLYIAFFDDLVECKYTCLRNLNGVIFMTSLSSLREEIFNGSQD